MPIRFLINHANLIFPLEFLQSIIFFSIFCHDFVIHRQFYKTSHPSKYNHIDTIMNGNQEITDYYIVLNTFLNETMPDALCALLD